MADGVHPHHEDEHGRRPPRDQVGGPDQTADQTHQCLPGDQDMHLRPGLEVVVAIDGLHRLAHQQVVDCHEHQSRHTGDHGDPKKVIPCHRADVTQVEIEHQPGGSTGKHHLAEVGHRLEPPSLLEIGRRSEGGSHHQSHPERGARVRLNSEDDPGGHHHHHR
jgi:hypothetical protein